MASVKFGMIGAGKMTGALMKSWVDKGVLQGAQVLASVPRQDKHLVRPLELLGCEITHSNRDVVNYSDVVLLGVKPHIVPLVAQEVRDLESDKLLVSVAAGLDIHSLQSLFGSLWRVVRVMPNTCVTVGEGASVYCLGQGTTGTDAELTDRLFSSVGLCEPVQERDIDAVTGVSGSGPAYLYLVVEAMADEGVRQGLDRAMAYRLAAQTLVGAGKMVLQTGAHPGELKDSVCSPGGSTIAALHSLEKEGLRAAMMGAVEAATLRCRQIKEQQHSSEERGATGHRVTRSTR